MISLLKVRSQVIHFVNLKTLSTRLSNPFSFDIRYARDDNFIKRKVYHSPDAFILNQVAEDLIKVQHELERHGYGILVFDAYRPWSVTKLFWDGSNDHDRQFLADPAKGSAHNRGCAIDLSMYYLNNGKAVTMPSDFDEMNEKAYVDYAEGDLRARESRDLLQATMKANGFYGIKNEWWHFNHASHQEWPVMNFTFEEIAQAPKSQLQLQGLS